VTYRKGKLQATWIKQDPTPQERLNYHARTYGRTQRIRGTGKVTRGFIFLAAMVLEVVVLSGGVGAIGSDRRNREAD
jgi:hypothetical protein